MRQILRVEMATGAVGLIGTYHPPQGGVAVHASSTSDARPGVLFVNFGQFDRAGPANLTVLLADRLSEYGYHVFRFDMPGLGDSPGDLPECFEVYWQFVEQAGETRWTCELVEALKQRFALPGLILGGLCSGALTSVFAAERLGSYVQGLLLLEPPVFLSPPPPAAGTATGLGSGATPEPRAPANHGGGRLLEAYRWLRSKARQSWCGSLLRHSRAAVKRGVATIVKPKFPPNADLRLIESWRKLGAAGMPMLVLCAPGPNPGKLLVRRNIFPPNKLRRITIVDVDQTNHLFTSGGGKQAVLDAVQHWMTANFPP